MNKTSLQKPASFNFDLICIGSGSGGGSAAVMAAKKGKRVALIEGSTFGGESPSYSCIPVNSFLQTVNYLEASKNAFIGGIETGRLNLNWQKAVEFKNECIKNTRVSESETAFRELGITLFKGFAKFADPWTIDINRKRITGQNVVIATGSTSLIPQIKGLNKVDFITFKEALNLPKLPASIFIIGGGTTGCALAEIFNGFGSRVYLAEEANNLLTREDTEVGQITAEILKNKGIHVMTGSQIIVASQISGDQKEIIVKNNLEQKNIMVEQVLVAAGKSPQVDLNLTAARVQFDNLGIKINRFLETTMNNIYAVGDVAGHDMLTHLAAYHSRLAIHNMDQAKTKDKIGLDYAAIPRCLALSPEIAATGLTEKELLQKQMPFKKSMVPIHGLDRSYLSNQTAGFVKLLCTPNKKLVGGSIIAPNAIDMITQLGLAINAKLSVADLKNNIKAFTSWSEAFNLACQKIK